jgi:hypothetical protein
MTSRGSRRDLQVSALAPPADYTKQYTKLG